MIASGVYAKFSEDLAIHVEARVYVVSIADGRLILTSLVSCVSMKNIAELKEPFARYGEQYGIVGSSIT